MVVYVLADRPLRFGSGVAAVFLVAPAVRHSTTIRWSTGTAVFSASSAIQSWLRLRPTTATTPAPPLHGKILHGKQFADEPPATDADRLLRPQRADRPTVRRAGRRQASPRDVAVLGLGTGTMAAYARRGDHSLLRDRPRRQGRSASIQSRYFSYVKMRKGAGPMSISSWATPGCRWTASARNGSGRKYDLIVVDAFSSDAIPVHLMTVNRRCAFTAPA